MIKKDLLSKISQCGTDIREEYAIYLVVWMENTFSFD